MNPNTTWEKLAATVASGNWEEAAELAENLTTWLSNGGFPPSITGRQGFDGIIVNATCQAVATWELG